MVLLQQLLFELLILAFCEWSDHPCLSIIKNLPLPVIKKLWVWILVKLIGCVIIWFVNIDASDACWLELWLLEASHLVHFSVTWTLGRWEHGLANPVNLERHPTFERLVWLLLLYCAGESWSLVKFPSEWIRIHLLLCSALMDLLHIIIILLKDKI